MPTAVAKPQATVDSQGCDETEPASGWPKERFLTPESDEDFVDPADEYKMPRGLVRMRVMRRLTPLR